jgi:hypothetical protein
MVVVRVDYSEYKHQLSYIYYLEIINNETSHAYIYN